MPIHPQHEISHQTRSKVLIQPWKERTVHLHLKHGCNLNPASIGCCPDIWHRHPSSSSALMAFSMSKMQQPPLQSVNQSNQSAVNGNVLSRLIAAGYLRRWFSPNIILNYRFYIHPAWPSKSVAALFWLVFVVFCNADEIWSFALERHESLKGIQQIKQIQQGPLDVMYLQID